MLRGRFLMDGRDEKKKGHNDNDISRRVGMRKTEEILTFCRDAYTIACMRVCFRRCVYTNEKMEFFFQWHSLPNHVNDFEMYRGILYYPIMPGN